MKKTELDEKIEKLSAFIESAKFIDVDIGEQRRMCRQLLVMKEYSGILGERIDAF